MDERDVEEITAFLFHAGGDDDPEKLASNREIGFLGCKIYGQGFLFDDADTKGVANPISRMQELIAEDPRNAERILPYIGGEEVNDNPTHAHHRHVINFKDFPLRRDDLGESWMKSDERQREAWLRTGVVPLDYPDAVAVDCPTCLG